MLIDSCAPVNNAGISWIKDYLDSYGIDYNKLKRFPCHQKFRFGSSCYLSEEIVEIPIVIQDKTGKRVSFVIPTFSLNGDTPFLLGKKLMKEWKAKIDLGEGELEISLNEKGQNIRRTFEMTEGSHPMIDLQSESNDDDLV